MKIMTHICTKLGCDARTPDNYKARTYLRETKNFWVDKHGTKYSKNDGYTLSDFPMYKIALDSITKLNNPVVIER